MHMDLRWIGVLDVGKYGGFGFDGRHWRGNGMKGLGPGLVVRWDLGFSEEGWVQRG